ncbi:hypothetical protein CRYUN_Cryun23aG0167200 [Craigia yunnanensis]
MIAYNKNDSYISLTFAKSNADFHRISGSHPRDVKEFHPLVPSLESSLSGDENHVIPLLSVKVTVFPNLVCGLNRFDNSVPATYFGNCVGFGRSEATRGDLIGETGIIFAAKAIGDTIKKLDKALLGEAERWISDWEVFWGPDLHIMVVGSPKLDFYEIEFGWGRPTKIEEISIDGWGAISLT